MSKRALGPTRLLAAAAIALGAFASPATADEPRAQEIRYEVPGEVPMLSPSFGLGPAVPILLTDDRLSPRRVEVRAGQTVSWTSMARDASRIVFEREVAKSMICHSLVNFELDGDQLRSAPLHTGEQSQFCRLSPGTYRYRIVRDGPGEHPTAGSRQLSTRLEGVIVVRPAGPTVDELAAR